MVGCLFRVVFEFSGSFFGGFRLSKNEKEESQKERKGKEILQRAIMKNEKCLKFSCFCARCCRPIYGAQYSTRTKDWLVFDFVCFILFYHHSAVTLHWQHSYLLSNTTTARLRTTPSRDSSHATHLCNAASSVAIAILESCKFGILFDRASNGTCSLLSIRRPRGVYCTVGRIAFSHPTLFHTNYAYVTHADFCSEVMFALNKNELPVRVADSATCST